MLSYFEMLSPKTPVGGDEGLNIFIFWAVRDISRTFEFLIPLKFPLGWGGSNFLGSNNTQIFSLSRFCNDNLKNAKGPFKCYVTQMGVGPGVSDILEKSVTKV